MHRFKSKHVPALDGLRGLAILLVIAHHQLIPFSVKGGFLGVDLFFVLSGFLITTLLVTEFETTKTISFRNFYARRALRLGPALLVYLVVCLVVTYHSHLMELTRELKLIGIALAYSTNWRMAFSWDTSLDPTAIIWSLSIEEQFYLLWPVLFLACLLVKFKRLHIVAVLSLAILSIFFHRYLLWRSGVELNRLYYGTDTRADAPLVGCLIALIPACSFHRQGLVLRWLHRRRSHGGSLNVERRQCSRSNACGLSGILSPPLAWKDLLWSVPLALATTEDHNLLLLGG